MARIKKVMSTALPILKKEAKIEEAALLLAQQEHSCIIIVDNEVPIGIVTHLDLIRSLVSKGIGLNEPVSKIMSSPVTTMAHNLKLDAALRMTDTKPYRRYPVVKDGKLIGVVDKKDVINKVSFSFKLHRSFQIIILIVFVLLEFFIFVYSKRFSA
ncbi:MAG: CBS domain-containing protein [Nanoarchaeota archaeon]